MRSEPDSTTRHSVLVAMSGGVDSSVSAALLLEAGYEVHGAFIKTWTAPWLPCTWQRERDDAERVAVHLSIPFETIDLSREYERDVVQYLVEEYAAGRTPNPDVMCNKHIKFGGFFAYAMEQGYDYVATGHYARTRYEDGWQLLSGVDRSKDQSYFLWTLTPEHLVRTLFPIGEYVKKDVRELARHFALPTADKKDSQGVCFLGQVDMPEFLRHYIEVEPGDVYDPMGRVIGKHAGAVFYTLGQRHGFSVEQSTPHAVPLYVVAKDVASNTIVVAPRSAEEVMPPSDLIELGSTNWIGEVEPGNYLGRLRYRQPLFEVALEYVNDGMAGVRPAQHQRYVQSGQSFVLYDNDRCLGGGVIRG